MNNVVELWRPWLKLRCVVDVSCCFLVFKKLSNHLLLRVKIPPIYVPNRYFRRRHKVALNKYMARNRKTMSNQNLNLQKTRCQTKDCKPTCRRPFRVSGLPPEGSVCMKKNLAKISNTASRFRCRLFWLATKRGERGSDFCQFSPRREKDPLHFTSSYPSISASPS